MIYPSAGGVPLNSLSVAPINYWSSSVQRKYVGQIIESSTAGNGGSQLCPALAFQPGP